MINKLCLVLAIAPLVILYIVKVCGDKYWLTVPLTFLIVLPIVLGTAVLCFTFFTHIGWLPED